MFVRCQREKWQDNNKTKAFAQRAVRTIRDILATFILSHRCLPEDSAKEPVPSADNHPCAFFAENSSFFGLRAVCSDLLVL